MAVEVAADYVVRALPGVVLGIALLAGSPRGFTVFRLFIHTFIFVLLRDLMTPVSLWSIHECGASKFPKPQFTRDPFLIMFLCFSSLAIVVLLWLLETELKRVVSWTQGTQTILKRIVPFGKDNALAEGLGLGFIGALAIAAPSLFACRFSGLLTMPSIPVLVGWLMFSLIGNLYEELLFRGFFQGLLEKNDFGNPRSWILSGIFFSFCHSFLAATVTSVGLTIHIFTLYEGLICAFCRYKRGLLSSTIAHGLGIFLIAALS
eukprot:TRINITY_DN23219_c0_g1_i1.p1 TRINITY_DN23219_c0_g1~~TRINITY_DN23219_c0_g1_i1.p1  ORF type:complete len:277 (+),score=20.52 TRINITY_DN23219_c0_g1_i1:48-833(+)